jgi:thiosulfate dehydrogenase
VSQETPVNGAGARGRLPARGLVSHRARAGARRGAAIVLLLAALGTLAASAAKSPAPNAANDPHASTSPSNPPNKSLTAASSPGIRVAGKKYETQHLATVDSLIPSGPLGESIRRGRAILWATRDSLAGHVGNSLRCVSCHLDGGMRASSGPWVGVAASFPQYNARAGRVILIADRINECLRRSMNGTPLALDSRDMRDLESAFAFMSNGVPQGTKSAWLGLRKLEPQAGDGHAGEALFAAKCARCHGASGQGTAPYPPLWGERSFAIGAGMARLNTMAAFIRWNMPFDTPGTLGEKQAFDIAAFVLSHARPDTPNKESDWPKGDAPPDCPYRATLISSRSTH